jgi:hypothetical protein
MAHEHGRRQVTTPAASPTEAIELLSGELHHVLCGWLRTYTGLEGGHLPAAAWACTLWCDDGIWLRLISLAPSSSDPETPVKNSERHQTINVLFNPPAIIYVLGCTNLWAC